MMPPDKPSVKVSVILEIQIRSDLTANGTEPDNKIIANVSQIIARALMPIAEEDTNIVISSSVIHGGN